jgi:hypothetical protein
MVADSTRTISACAHLREFLSIFSMSQDTFGRLQALADLLFGFSRTADHQHLWERIATKASNALQGKRCRIESARLSVDRRYLAVCCEIRTLLGLRLHYAGLLYSIDDTSIVGRIALGKRTPKGWTEISP